MGAKKNYAFSYPAVVILNGNTKCLELNVNVYF